MRVHPQARVLGAPLEAGKNLYQGTYMHVQLVASNLPPILPSLLIPLPLYVYSYMLLPHVNIPDWNTVAET